jgi:hypothetical protein
MRARGTAPKAARPAQASTRGMVFTAAALIAAALAGCSSPAPVPPVRTQGARILHLTIDSRFVHGTMPLTLVTPAGGGAHRPLLVFLHGLHSLGYDNNSQLTGQMFAALHALGPRAPDIAFPYGDDSYWVNSASGAWSFYVLDEVIPKALTVLHADPRRVAIGGISMGGFGAYAIARLDPGRFCAVGGHSTAINAGNQGSSLMVQLCAGAGGRQVGPGPFRDPSRGAGGAPACGLLPGMWLGGLRVSRWPPAGSRSWWLASRFCSVASGMVDGPERG